VLEAAAEELAEELTVEGATVADVSAVPAGASVDVGAWIEEEEIG
jgi:hypothetical protein